MDFADERYVRLYVRDTPTWKAWRWEAKALASLLLRKLDRSGRLEWPPRIDPARAVAGVVEMPIEVVESALLDMQDTETIEIGPGWLEWPRFVPGQNAKSRAKSNAERTAEWKERTSYDDKRRRGGDVASPAETSEPLSCAVLSGAQLSGAETHTAPDVAEREPPHSVETPAEALVLSGQGSTKPKNGRRGKPRTDYPTDLEETFLSLLVAACREVGLRGPRKVTDEMRDHLRKLWAACEPTVEELEHVIAVRREMNRRSEGYGSLTWDSICVPGNFRRWLAQSLGKRPAANGRVEPGPRPTETKVIDLRAMARPKES